MLITVGASTGVWGQTTQVYSLTSKIPDSTLTVTVNPTSLQPGNLFTEMPTLAAKGEGGAGDITYSWSPTSGLSDPNIAAPVLTYDLSQTILAYTVTVTDALGCTESAEITIDYSVSRESETILPVSMTIAPNPSNGLFHLSLEGNPLPGEMSMTILDPLGRIVHSQDLGRFNGRFEQDMDLSHLENGLYFIGIASNGKTAVAKIILQ